MASYNAIQLLVDYRISKHIVWFIVVIPFTAKEILHISYLHSKEVISYFAFRELSDWSRNHVMQHDHFSFSRALCWGQSLTLRS